MSKKEPLTLSIPEAGRLFGIGRDASYKAALRGEIRTIKLGRTSRVPCAWIKQTLGIDALPGF